MGDKRRGNNRGGGRSRGRGGFRDRNSRRSGGSPKGRFGGRDRRPVEQHDVICSECGKECQVPFKPTGSKPVLCRDCFGSRGNSRGGSGSRPSGMSSEQMEQINTKLDKILDILQNVM